MCVCVHACMYIYTHVNTCVYLCGREREREREKAYNFHRDRMLSAHTFVYTYIYEHMHSCTLCAGSVSVCARACTYHSAIMAACDAWTLFDTTPLN